MKKIIKYALNIFIFVAFPVILFTVITSRTPLLFGLRSFNVLTGSMTPAIKTGSIVYTINDVFYNRGDIITFKRGNISVTHRIVQIIAKDNQIFYMTKGDANKIADVELVSQYDVIGKDFLIIPYLGQLTDFLKTVPGFIILIFFPILIHILLEARVIKKEWEKEIEKRVLARIETSQQI